MYKEVSRQLLKVPVRGSKFASNEHFLFVASNVAKQIRLKALNVSKQRLPKGRRAKEALNTTRGKRKLRREPELVLQPSPSMTTNRAKMEYVKSHTYTMRKLHTYIMIKKTHRTKIGRDQKSKYQSGDTLVSNRT